MYIALHFRIPKICGAESMSLHGRTVVVAAGTSRSTGLDVRRSCTLTPKRPQSFSSKTTVYLEFVS